MWSSNLRNTRPETHANRIIVNQLPDDEDDSCIDPNGNFKLSRNMDTHQVGNPWANSNGDESDEDGSLFAKFYQTCFECPKKILSRSSMEELQAKYGEVGE